MDLDTANKLHRDGRLAEAETAYRALLKAAPPVQPARWTVVPMAAVAALPVRWLWKNQLALGNVATTMTGDDNNEMSAEDPKVRF